MNQDYAFEIYRSGTSVPQARRPAIIEAMNHELICTNWHFDYPHYSDEMHPFHEKYSIIFAFHRGKLAGYTIYQFSEIEGVPAVYRFASEIKKDRQGEGLYKTLTDHAFVDIWSRIPGAERFLFAWRTRNPIVWRASARRCASVVPALASGADPDPALLRAGQRLAAELYPATALEVPSMVMRNVYTHMRYHTQPYLNGDHELNRAFDRLIPDKEDSIFSIGWIERP